VERAQTLFLAGRGDGTFAPAAVLPERLSGQLLAADLDRDGQLDLVASDPLEGLALASGLGTGAFSPAQRPALGRGRPGLAGLGRREVDGDGRLDLVGARFGVLAGDGAGGLLPPADAGFELLAAGDFGAGVELVTCAQGQADPVAGRWRGGGFAPTDVLR